MNLTPISDHIKASNKFAVASDPNIYIAEELCANMIKVRDYFKELGNADQLKYLYEIVELELDGFENPVDVVNPLRDFLEFVTIETPKNNEVDNFLRYLYYKLKYLRSQQFITL